MFRKGFVHRAAELQLCAQARQRRAPAERLLWPGRASPSAPQLLAFSPGKEQAAGAPLGIVRRNPQVPHTAREVTCHPVNNWRGKQNSIPPHKTRPDSPVLLRKTPSYTCDRQANREPGQHPQALRRGIPNAILGQEKLLRCGSRIMYPLTTVPPPRKSMS